MKSQAGRAQISWHENAWALKDLLLAILFGLSTQLIIIHALRPHVKIVLHMISQAKLYTLTVQIVEGTLFITVSCLHLCSNDHVEQSWKHVHKIITCPYRGLILKEKSPYMNCTANGSVWRWHGLVVRVSGSCARDPVSIPGRATSWPTQAFHPSNLWAVDINWHLAMRQWWPNSLVRTISCVLTSAVSSPRRWEGLRSEQSELGKVKPCNIGRIAVS